MSTHAKRQRGIEILKSLESKTTQHCYFEVRELPPQGLKPMNTTTLKALPTCRVCAIGALIQQLPDDEFGQVVQQIAERNLNTMPIGHPGMRSISRKLTKAFGFTNSELVFIQHMNDSRCLAEAIEDLTPKDEDATLSD